jgi:hypothetical protein
MQTFSLELFTSEEGYYYRLDRENYTKLPFDIHITIYNETKEHVFITALQQEKT